MTSRTTSPTRSRAGGLERASELVAARGARVTRARVEVLATLLASHDALSHHDVGRRLPRGHDIDRVTLYRVLEWLTGQGLAHKVASDDRVWRFASAGPGEAGDHAHFECDACGRVVCLDETRVPAIPLPSGFRRANVDVRVRGTCDSCAS